MLSKLLIQLYESKTADEAVLICLQGLNSVVGEAQNDDGNHTLLRATIHLRPNGDYRSLFSFDHEKDALHDLVDEADFHLSSSAWNFLAEEKRPIQINITFGVLKSTAGTTRNFQVQEDGQNQSAPSNPKAQMSSRILFM